jgi:hypothetical protein
MVTYTIDQQVTEIENLTLTKIETEVTTIPKIESLTLAISLVTNQVTTVKVGKVIRITIETTATIKVMVMVTETEVDAKMSLL